MGFQTLFAQDLNCVVEVIDRSGQQASDQITADLKNSITQFMNNKKWVNGEVAANEKIDCNVVFEVTAISSDQFMANINIQSSRTVFNSTYNTKVFTYLDRGVAFKYTQFQTIEFQENTYSGNLSSILAFYAYIIVGLDFDSYQLNAGDPYFNKALNIKNVANIADANAGWASNSGNGSRNRHFLIDNLLDPRFKPLRSALYRYHIKGLDVMSTDIEKGRNEVYESVKELKLVFDALPNAFFLKIFFDAKMDEMIQVFSQASPTIKNKVVEMLAKMDPANRGKYEEGILRAKN